MKISCARLPLILPLSILAAACSSTQPDSPLGGITPPTATTSTLLPHAAGGALQAASLPDSELTLARMLTLALEDEYLARGEYALLIERFGERRPFSRIVKAEERHIASLIPLFARHGIPVPADRGREAAQLPASLKEARAIGVTAERSNIAMYERFLRQELPDDVRRVFENLRAASRNHLAAFGG